MYRDGRDSMAFHRDRDLRWLDDTLVALLVLGERRPFHIRPRANRYAHELADKGATHDVHAGRGDLLVMGGACQAGWEHSVPKVPGHRAVRVSIQWRWAGRTGPAGRGRVVPRASALQPLKAQPASGGSMGAAGGVNGPQVNAGNHGAGSAPPQSSAAIWSSVRRPLHERTRSKAVAVSVACAGRRAEHELLVVTPEREHGRTRPAQRLGERPAEEREGQGHRVFPTRAGPVERAADVVLVGHLVEEHLRVHPAVAEQLLDPRSDLGPLVEDLVERTVGPRHHLRGGPLVAGDAVEPALEHVVARAGQVGGHLTHRPRRAGRAPVGRRPPDRRHGGAR